MARIPSSVTIFDVPASNMASRDRAKLEAARDRKIVKIEYNITDTRFVMSRKAARDRKIVKIEYNITDTRFVMSRRGAKKAAGGR